MVEKIRASALRKENKDSLLKKVNALKAELKSLRVAQATGGAPAKLMKINTVRKSIARVMTVVSQTRHQALRAYYAKKKYVPLDLRSKKTRAIRRALTPAQQNKKSLAQIKRAKMNPIRRYALKA